MARERTYGWTPEQMARINARREARGQQPYIDKNMGREDYAKKYLAESDSYSGKKRGAEVIPEEDDNEVSLTDRQAERKKAFREKFKPTTSLKPQTSLASNKAIRDEEFNRRFGRKSTGVNPETVGGAYRRVIGQIS